MKTIYFFVYQIKNVTDSIEKYPQHSADIAPSDYYSAVYRIIAIKVESQKDRKKVAK